MPIPASYTQEMSCFPRNFGKRAIPAERYEFRHIVPMPICRSHREKWVGLFGLYCFEERCAM